MAGAATPEQPVHPRFGSDPLPGRGTYPIEPAEGGGWRTIGGSFGAGGEPQWSTPRLNLGGTEGCAHQGRTTFAAFPE